MKAIVFAAALEEKLITPRSSFDCQQGSITFANHRYRDWRSFGRLTAREILAFSSNIGTFSIAERLGRKRLYSYLKLFGFGQRTGIDFPGEAQGILYSPNQWSLLSVPSISIVERKHIPPKR
jgi:cell division protein FtsI (penicillin-binding protein 3)